MKVLLINYEFPPLGSGAANASRHLARQFQRRGHEVVVLTSSFRGLPRREIRDGVRIVRIAVPRRREDRCPPSELLAFAAASIPAAVLTARSERPDVCLAFFGFPCGPAAWAVKRKCGVPYCVSLRNADVPRPSVAESRLLQIPLRWLVRRVWRAADAVVAVSEGLADAARGVEPGLECRVIPNGVDTDVFRPAPPGSRTAAGPVQLLYVGRLRRFKGLQDLLPAVAQAVRRGGLRCRLDIVGEGPFRGELARRVRRLRLEGVVRFQGRVPREGMPEVYRRADIFVFPSHAEGMPNALLEAMASGLTAIATDIEGSRELIREGVEGCLVPAGNVESLADAIVSLAGDPSRRKALGRRARERAAAFSWEGVATMYLDVLEALVR